MPVELGSAVGTISISTAGVTAANQTVKGASADMTKSLSGVGKGVGGLQSKFRELDSFLGASFLVGAAVGIGRTVLELGRASAQADLTKKSSDSMAAGVGQDANKMLEGMRKASHGVVTDSALILGANRAIAGGVASTSEDMNQILTIARATGAAFGFTTAEAFQRITEGVAKLEPELLDELGITVRLDTVFRQYAASLGTTAEKLTDAQRKQAFLNEIIKQTKPAVDAAGDAVDSNVDKYEKLNVATDRLGKSFGHLINAAGTPTIIDTMASDLDVNLIPKLKATTDLLGQVLALGQAIGGFAFGAPATPNTSGTAPWGTRGAPPVGVAAAVQSREETQVHLDWAKGIQDVNDQVRADILDEETSFGEQRAKTVADYSKGIAREERDFARTRLRAEMDMLDSIAGLSKDAARREGKQSDDLERGLASTRADAAEREVETRKDAAKQLSKLDEDYQKERLKRAKDLSDSLLDAAGDLDAKQVYELQRDGAKQAKEAADAHDDARKAITDGLQERLDQEAKALAKSLKQQQDNYDRQIADGRENDRLRLEDMKADFVKRKAQEDADRVIRLGDEAADHAAQLTELDTQHGLRIAQIKDHAADERIALAAEADAALVAAKVADDATRKRVEAKEKHLEDMWDKYHKHIEDSLNFPGKVKDDVYPPSFAGGGYVPSTGLAMLHAGEYVTPARSVSRGGAGGRSAIFNGDIQVNVNGSNASAGDIGRAVRQELLNVFEGAGDG